MIHSTYTASITFGVLFLVGAILRVNSFSKRRFHRPEVIPPGTERVLVLGASTGIGRTLAHRYAERGAKVCVVARKSAELKVVRSECEVRAPAPDSVLNICADITRAEDLITIREAISDSAFSVESISHSLICIYRVARCRHAHCRCWRLCLASCPRDCRR